MTIGTIFTGESPMTIETNYTGETPMTIGTNYTGETPILLFIYIPDRYIVSQDDG